ncbi:MAG: N(4)-(beta-N-acetylglucosaminyl)-L-asparaginase [Gemmatimonadetes bacterium]|nr:N(4)-(beta-N-acetylglucosaminyl)-L-asparaginase [Gemmatimonadota bacterium]
MSSRRNFLRTTAGAGLGAATLGRFPFARELAAAPISRAGALRPVVIASANGLQAVERAMQTIQAGGDTIEAVVQGVNIVELDPQDNSVGYGGLPNEDGVVQLDASVMHGPTRGAGAVASLEGVKTPSRVAVAVMRYTDHVLLVGAGAREFARKLGFNVNEDLLTEDSRRRWLEWRASLSPDDDWISPEEAGAPPLRTGGRGAMADPRRDGERALLDSYDGLRPWGTINCNAVDRNGNISGVTTTSGLAWKIPGRVGDSPILGAGLYVDNDVGACGSTGRGEAVLKTVGSHTVVENMRRRMSPTDACLEALHRVVRWTVEKRLLGPDGRPNFNVNFYALNKNGDYGAAAIWSGSRFAVSVDGRAQLRDSAYLFQRA